MVMSWIWCGIILISIVSSLQNGTGTAMGAAVLEGAQNGINLALTIAGPICLWTGVARLMDRIGMTDKLAKLMLPFLRFLFPQTRDDPTLRRDLSANVCANILGLGNAATPMGIKAAKQMAAHCLNGTASDELCRLIVLNTASIQLIPANVAALRSANGCLTPFDILPAVWITSLCSAGLGLAAAYFLRKVWQDA